MGKLNLDLKENMVASVQRTPVADNAPKPGTAIIEVFNEDGQKIAMDTVAAPAAPRGALKVGPYPATLVRIGATNLCHQFVELPLPVPEGFGLKLPQTILDKQALGATRITIYWSCHA